MSDLSRRKDLSRNKENERRRKTPTNGVFLQKKGIAFPLSLRYNEFDALTHYSVKQSAEEV